MEPERRPRLLAGLAVLALVAVLAWVTSPAWVVARLSWVAGDPLRLTVALVALAVVRPLVAWPTTTIAVVAGYGFGPAGFPLALGLVVLTSVPPYWVARRGRGEGRLATAGERFVDATGGVRGVTASRLVPAPSDVVSVAAGVAGVRLGAFAVGTALGEVPWVAAGVVAGDSLDALTAGSLASTFDPTLVAGSLAVGVLMLAGPLYRLYAEWA
ncbi:MAG: TVP38/TMEM64 family protein [Haloplanus sp.]